MNRFHTMRAFVRCVAGALVGLPALVRAQTGTVVTAAFDTTKWIAPRQAIELHVAGEPTATRRRIAVLVGSNDLSALFRTSGDTLRYQPQLLALPPGDQQLVVYSVSSEQQWTELARFPLHVLTLSGYEQADLLPRLTFSLKGQVAEGHGVTGDAPPRAEYQDLVVNTGLQTLHRGHGLTLRSQVNVLAASNRQETLRFNELAGAAPKVDLADYDVYAEARGFSATLGHQTFGLQRHLATAFGSRGVGAAAHVGERARISFVALNGNAIVGWSNALGISRPDNRVLGGSLALDVVPRRPGLVEVEGTVLDGFLLPEPASIRV